MCAGIAGLYGLDGSVNATGDDVKKLDVMSNDTFFSLLKRSGAVSVLVSEENPAAEVVDNPKANYCLVFDPLDGSSNIDCNVSVGSIWGVYRKTHAGAGSAADVLRPGAELVSAGYCMYGSSTQIVMTTGHGVHIFTLDPAAGEFLLTSHNVRVPDAPKAIYSVNEGNSALWDAPTRDFVAGCKAAKPAFSARYVGSMVADVHRTLLYGGIFMYPADAKSPAGKLRLLYEGNPMAMIMEQAGGLATTGKTRILDIMPRDIHERVPVFLGCRRDVEKVIALYAAAAAQ
jgi:fructose-1,6-bisphosphatase I